MDKLIVFQKSYQFLFWVRPTVERFSKVHKYSLGIEFEKVVLTMLSNIVRANYAEKKHEFIAEALVDYELIRVYLRLSFEYKLINKRQFTFSSKKLDEIGRLLRGWKRKAS